ncbi:MAG: cardiolipin synthase [Vibrio sp.]
MIEIIVPVFYTLGVATALHAAMTARTPTGAVAWVVSLLSIPFIAVPLYAVFGRNRFQGRAEAFKQKAEEINTLMADCAEKITPWKLSQNECPTWFRAIQDISVHSLVTHNSVKLLINGTATFDSILDGIAQAKQYILFQFYMIRDDQLGQQIKQALSERAQAGVKVTVLFDEVGSQGLSDSYIEEMRSSGIEVSSFKPNQGWFNRLQLNFRNHRKMMVVDGHAAWVGGHNIGDEYMGRDPKLSPWRDTHVKIEGPAVLQVQLTLLADWYWATRKIPSVNWTPVPAPQRNQQVMTFPTAPTGSLENASLFFVTAINSAKHRVWISSPYFIPDEAVMKALQLAALRGVDVRIITTGNPDSLPVYLASFHYIEQLLELNIRFFAYKPGFIHQKAMLVDDHTSSVGTHNFDNRSFRLNFEISMVMADKHFAQQVQTMFEQDFDDAKVIEPQTLRQRPLWWWVGVKLSRLLAPVL